MSQSDQRVKPIALFYSYSHKDEEFREQLETHLSLLARKGVISTWNDRKIAAGTEWKNQIDDHIKLAQIILLLISADFLASDYCYDVEMTHSMQRHEEKDVRVIPVILRPCDWSDAPFGKLQALPKNAKPITTWSNIDEAWLDVAQSVRLVCQEIQQFQFTGIEIYCEPMTKPVKSVWPNVAGGQGYGPRCAVRAPGAPERSYDWLHGATIFGLAYGESIKIPLKPQIEYTIIAFTSLPMSNPVRKATIKCKVKENEVVQYVYRAVENPDPNNHKMQGQLVEVYLGDPGKRL